MAAFFGARAARPVFAAAAAMPIFSVFDRQEIRHRLPARCDAKAFEKATCVSNERHTHDTRKIRFALDAGPRSFWTEQGPIANLRVQVQVPEAQLARPYNPLSAELSSEFEILVKRYPDGKVGSALHNLKPGESVGVSGPNQQWRFEAGKYKDYAMLAGGTGITPLFQCASYILAHDPAAKVTMISFQKTSSDVLLNAELTKLKSCYPNRLQVLHVIESEQGRASVEMLRKLLPSPTSEALFVMVCGPQAMTAAIAGAKSPDYSQGEIGGMLKDLAFSKEQIWKV